MAESTAKAAAEAITPIKDVLVDRLKTISGLSLKAGIVVGVTTFGVLLTVTAVSATVGIGQGIAEGIKEVRNAPNV